MMLTDREWLRFVTFALVVGGVLGALGTGALAVAFGRGLVGSLVGGVGWTASLAILFHLTVRALLDRAYQPTTDTTDATEETNA